MVKTALYAVGILFVLVFLIGALLSVNRFYGDFIRSKTVDVDAERLQTSSMVVEAIPRGYLQVKMQGYSFDYSESEDKLNLSFKGSYSERKIGEFTGYSEVVYEGDQKEVEDYVCLVKKDAGDGGTLVFKVDKCG